jgi:hypothetical protein
MQSLPDIINSIIERVGIDKVTIGDFGDKSLDVKELTEYILEDDGFILELEEEVTRRVKESEEYIMQLIATIAIDEIEREQHERSYKGRI